MSDYYLEIVTNQHDLIQRHWLVDGDTAHMDMQPSQMGSHVADAGEDILTTLLIRFPMGTFHKLTLGPGEYYPRMARPGYIGRGQSPGVQPDQSADAINVRTISTGQLDALIQELKQICRVVHPVQDNFKTYGHEIRNLLIIACTEIEAQWKSILKANHAKAINRFDYVKLSAAMRLPEYQVALPWYPWLAPISPFSGWVPAPNSLQNLPWYDAYNAVKHNREGEFAEAKLEHALTALTGCFVMLCAQYGWGFAKQPDKAGDAFFTLLKAPEWEPSELYVGGGTLKERDYPFTP